jgi:hypothetical protein
MEFEFQWWPKTIGDVTRTPALAAEAAQIEQAIASIDTERRSAKDAQTLGAVILTMGQQLSRELTLWEDEHNLLVDADGPYFIVTVDTSPPPGATNYWFIPNPDVDGTTNMWIGGQPSGPGTAAIATAEQAIALATEFFLTGRIDRSRGNSEAG